MNQNNLLPIFLKVKNQPCLIVGGGKIAYQKIKQLVVCKADISVISKKCINEIEELYRDNKIKLIKSRYYKKYIIGYKLIISATSDNKVNKQVYSDAEKLGIPVNIVDEPELCSYYFGSVHSQGSLKVAVSTNGESPSAGKRIRELIAQSMPDKIDSILNRFNQLRKKIKSNMSYYDRKMFFGNLAKKHIDFNKGRVIIVGAGPGSPELLTLKAAESISSADIILYDALIHPDILSLGSKKCKKIFTGKRSGENCIKQNAINEMMKDFAKSGKIVVRLKGGDPFVFGRGGEEVIFLRNHQIPFNIVPGISSGIGVATQTGIPLTHRDYSKGVLFLTGHQYDGNNNIDWDLVSKLNMTLVIYMGYRKLNKIVSALIKSGKDPETPIGLIEKGTTAQQKVIVGKIGSIDEKIKTMKLETPIIIIIGDVLNIYKYLKDYIEISPTLYPDTNNFGTHQIQDISS